MGEIIIHHKGKWNIWSTVVDAPLCAEAMTLKELTAWVEGRHGASGLRELPPRLDRAHQHGTSANPVQTLEELCGFNRAGENEACLPISEVIERYLK